MHWYAFSTKTGMATLCASEQDARREAPVYDRLYPGAAPHIATQLIPAKLVRDALPVNAADPEDPELYRLAELLGLTANT